MRYMGLLRDAQNCGLCMRRECRECFPRNRLQRKPPVSDPGMYHGTYVTHVPWCMSGSVARGGGENVPGIPGAYANLNFMHLTRGPCNCLCTTRYKNNEISIMSNLQTNPLVYNRFPNLEQQKAHNDIITYMQDIAPVFYVLLTQP